MKRQGPSFFARHLSFGWNWVGFGLSAALVGISIYVLAGLLKDIDGARLVGKQIHQNPARVVDQIAESLRHQDAVHIAGSGLIDLLEVVIGKRLLQRDLDRRGGLAFIGNNTGRHGGVA